MIADLGFSDCWINKLSFFEPRGGSGEEMLLSARPNFPRFSKSPSFSFVEKQRCYV